MQNRKKRCHTNPPDWRRLPTPFLYDLLLAVPLRDGAALACSFGRAHKVWGSERLWVTRLQREFGVAPLKDETARQAYREEWKLAAVGRANPVWLINGFEAPFDLTDEDFRYRVAVRGIKTGASYYVWCAMRHGLDPNEEGAGDAECGDYLPIIHAIRAGSRDVATRLVEYGVDLERCDGVGSTVLANAAIQGDKKMFGMMLEKSADASITLVSLIWVVTDSCLWAIRRIFDSGKGDVNYIDSDGWTLLHMASWLSSRDLATVVLLLERGVNPTLKTKNGETALDFALNMENGRKRDPTLISYLECAMDDWVNQ